MTKITEEMIETAFEVFFTKDQDIEPIVQLGMNEGSAKMTIIWFKHLFSGELYKRSASTMQIEWVLNKLYQTQDYNKLKSTLKSLNKYCDFYDEKPMVVIRCIVKEFENKLTDTS